MKEKLFDEKLAKCKEKLAKALESICSVLRTDEAKKAFRRSCYIAGGAIWSTFNDEKPNDYDIFCRNAKDRLAVVDGLGDPDVSTGNADTYDMVFDGKICPVQFIGVVFGEPDKVIEQFDFEHNMFAFDCFGKFFSKEEDFLINKVLVANPLNKGDLNTVVCRVPKFCARGFAFSDMQMAELLIRLQKAGGINKDILDEVITNAYYDPRSFGGDENENEDTVEIDGESNAN